MNFYDLMASLARMGVWDIILPFMLVFTIVYATLTATVFNDADKKKFASIISLVIALGVVIPHSIGAYPPGMNVVLIINTALPNVALISVAIIGLFILLGLFGINFGGLNGAPIMPVIVGFAVLAILFVFTSASTGYTIPPFLNFLNDPDTQALFIVVIVFWLLVKFITKTPKSGDDGMAKFKKGLEDISSLFKSS